MTSAELQQAAGPLGWLHDAAATRAAAGLSRTLVPRAADSGVVDLASNDYLGLSTDPRVCAAAVEAVRTWGAGATGSRLVSGTTQLHADLETALARLAGAPAALVFSSGYQANLAAVAALGGRDCLVVSDAGNHASLVDGCRLSRSEIAVTPSGDLDAAERALSARTVPRALVVIDAIGSADGRLTPLVQWHALARRHGAVLVVDDAHGLGVRGNGAGSVAEAGLAGEDDVVLTLTLSKALGSQGGAVLGAPAVIRHLIETARSFIFDTGLNPAAAGAALAAVHILAADLAGLAGSGPTGSGSTGSGSAGSGSTGSGLAGTGLAGSVLTRAADLAAAAGVPGTDSAVVPVLIGDAAQAYALSRALLERGFRVGCFRPPSVPAGTARLRLTARSTLTSADLERFRAALLEARADTQADTPARQR